MEREFRTPAQHGWDGEFPPPEFEFSGTRLRGRGAAKVLEPLVCSGGSVVVERGEVDFSGGTGDFAVVGGGVEVYYSEAGL